MCQLLEMTVCQMFILLMSSFMVYLYFLYDLFSYYFLLCLLLRINNPLPVLKPVTVRNLVHGIKVA